MRAGLKIIAINLAVAAILLLATETGYRAIKYVGSCLTKQCDASYWTLGNKFKRNVDIGISRSDATLGHVPNDGSYLVDWQGLTPTRVTIRNGVRANASVETIADAPPTLAIGDSFTFGDEVSDSETWPACLERQWNTRVVNAGVFGYGAAQAVLRAQQLQHARSFDRIIWSILVGHDFSRDVLVARSSSPRPAVVADERGLRYSSIAESQQILDSVTQNWLAKYAHAFGYFYVTKLAWQKLSRYLLPPGTSFDGRWSVTHPHAAPREGLMTFAFDQFAALDAREKYVLVQYPKDSLPALRRREVDEVAAIRRLAHDRGITVIDSLPVLRASPDPDSLYRKHHTPAGNWVVCRSIVAAVNRPHSEG